MHLDEKKYQELKLIRLLKDDSEYAFQLIYDHYRNRIYKLAMMYLKSPVLAQEAVQDVFLKLWFSRNNLMADTSLEPWLLKVTKNHLINQLKSIATQWIKVNDEDYINSLPADILDNEINIKEYKKHLNYAIERLPAKQKEVFLLSREEGLSYLQIGERLNMSPLTVKTHIARALKALKHYLKENHLLSFLLV